MRNFYTGIRLINNKYQKNDKSTELTTSSISLEHNKQNISGALGYNNQQQPNYSDYRMDPNMMDPNMMDPSMNYNMMNSNMMNPNMNMQQMYPSNIDHLNIDLRDVLFKIMI